MEPEKKLEVRKVDVFQIVPGTDVTTSFKETFPPVLLTVNFSRRTKSQFP